MLMWTYVTLRLSWQIARSWRGGVVVARLPWLLWEWKKLDEMKTVRGRGGIRPQQSQSVWLCSTVTASEGLSCVLFILISLAGLV